MPKITQGNRLYFYRLFLREIGLGNQVRIARFEEALEADDILPDDCDCESLTELIENLDEIVKITTFKKGRVFATLQGNAEYDEALEKAALPQDNKDVRAGKSWKRKKAGKVVKPAKPRHKKVSMPPAPEAQDAPALEPTIPADEVVAELAAIEEATLTTPERDAAWPGAPEQTDTSQLSEPEESTEQAEMSRADEASADTPGEAPIDTPNEVPIDTSGEAAVDTPSEDAVDAATEAPEPSISLTITYDPREDESVANLYPNEEKLPSEGSFSFEEDGALAEETVRPTLGIPPAPAEAIPHQSGFPRTISADVSCKDAMLGLLYEVLPLDVDPMAALDEGWFVARSTSTLTGSRNRVTFPLRYLHERDGLPIEVTITHIARSTSGKHWELVSVNGVDASWEGSLARTQAPEVGGTPSPLCTLTAPDAAGADDPEREFARFAHLGSWKTALAALAEITTPERWSLPGDAGGEHALLRAYIAATFHRVRREGKIAYAKDGSLAAFDTGLLAPMGESVYACLSARDGEPSWELEGFCASGTGELGARLASVLDTLPERATYLDDLNLVSLSPTARVDADTSALLGELDCLGRPGEVGGVDERELARAIEHSVNRAKASFRVGTPAYDAASDKVKLLIPLCLSGSVRACGAVVLSPVTSGEGVAHSDNAGKGEADRGEAGSQGARRYRAEAIVSLERAWACARTISQEQPRWLTPAAEE
ncbi:MAG: DUF3825 domain-containing protein [Olsenella sp.]|nr:DUF3825 domain-containing protein [Olsenella sp.]